jgi:hypothetical protein
MICGLKWKSCNCPWFTYDAAEADRLNHMQVPGEPEQRPNRLRRARPNNFDDEMNQRRRQERADEELARRLQRVGMEDGDEDYQGGIGDVHGIGNGAAHFMNQDYIRAAQNILTATYDQATAAANYVMGVAQARGAPPPPENGPRRMVDRYPAPQAAPTARASIDEFGPRPPARRAMHRRTTPEPSPSVLAGLVGARRGSNRVDAWRTHVEPGVTPAEGLLSM